MRSQYKAEDRQSAPYEYPYKKSVPWFHPLNSYLIHITILDRVEIILIPFANCPSDCHSLGACPMALLTLTIILVESPKQGLIQPDKTATRAMAQLWLEPQPFAVYALVMPFIFVHSMLLYKCRGARFAFAMEAHGKCTAYGAPYSNDCHTPTASGQRISRPM